MRQTRGAPCSLDDKQIHYVLRWHARRQRFIERFGTVRDFAKREGIPLAQARRGLRQSSGAASGNTGSNRNVGRPAELNAVQRVALARWRRAYWRYLDDQPSAAQLASELGVSRFTIFDCIKRNGRYLQRHRPEKQNHSPVRARGRSSGHDAPAKQDTASLKPCPIAWVRGRRRSGPTRRG
jgi:hypothetical protein